MSISTENMHNTPKAGAQETLQAPLLNTYGARFPVLFVSGSGTILHDDQGKEYLDFLGGLAVTALGHAHPGVTAAVTAQAGKLVHVSNLFWTEPMAQLAFRLREITGWGRTFFANSGAEAVECALKLVRKWAGPERPTVLCAVPSFHGRTFGALAATGQPAKQQGFLPLPAGFAHAPFNDLKAFEDAVDSTTAAILVEPILGECGVVPATPDFLQGLRTLCNERDLALVFDEVQTGVGRTGHWWAHQSYGVLPDVLTSAKALANGFPIGACVAGERLADAFVPGDHGSTFGGNPVVCAAALATLDLIEQEGLLDRVPELGAQLVTGLEKLPGVRETRGLGLLQAAVLDAPIAVATVNSALVHGLVVNAPAPDVLRFAPPLTVSPAEIDEALQRLGSALAHARHADVEAGERSAAKGDDREETP